MFAMQLDPLKCLLYTNQSAKFFLGDKYLVTQPVTVFYIVETKV